MNAIPISSRSPAANGQNSVVIFDRAELDVVLIICHFANLSVLRNFTTETQSDSAGIDS